VEVADERAALIALAAMGIRVAPGAPFMVGVADTSHIRVTTGQLHEDNVDQLQGVILALAAAAGAGPTLRGV
jgi:DNA-binding transcriptional MocR family regulator